MNNLKPELLYEFLAFTGTRLFLSGKDHMQIELVPFDNIENHLQIKIKDTEALKQVSDLVGKKQSFRTVYRSFLIGFETEVRVSGDTLVLALPTKIESLENRKATRYPVLASSYDQIQLQVRGMSLKVAHIVDLSQRGICLMIERSSGYLKENDRVENLTILKGGEVIFKNTGRVERIHYVTTDRVTYIKVYIVLDLRAENPSHAAQDLRQSERLGQEIFQRAILKFQNPFFPDKELVANIVELSTSGLLLENTLQLPIPVGTRVTGCQLVFFNGDTNKLNLEVVRQTEERGTALKVENCEHDFLIQVKTLANTSRRPNVFILSEPDLENFWGFVFESKFIYKDKRSHLQSNANRVLETYANFARSRNNFSRNYIFKEQNLIKGYLSTIKVYDNSWIIQHLSAKKSSGVSVARNLLAAISDFFDDKYGHGANNNDYVFSYYRPNNFYPNFLFGNIRDYVNDPTICNTQTFKLFTLNDELAPKANPNIVVRDATEQDLFQLEKIISESKFPKIAEIESIYKEKIEQRETEERFASIGLVRKRKVVVTEYTHQASRKVFALCDFSSPGLNLSELLNSVKLYASGTQGLDGELAAHVAHHVRPWYAEFGISRPLYLTNTNARELAGFTWYKDYIYWYFKIQHCKLFKESCEHIFKNFKTRILISKLWGNKQKTA